MPSPAFLALLPSLVASGIADIAAIKQLFQTTAPGMTDAELNAICDLIIASAQKHKALADLDKVG